MAIKMLNNRSHIKYKIKRVTLRYGGESSSSFWVCEKYVSGEFNSSIMEMTFEEVRKRALTWALSD